MVKRINIALSDDVLTRIDKFASSRGYSRSRCIAECMLDYISAMEKADVIRSQLADFGEILAKYMKGEISEDEYKEKIASFKV